MIRKAGQEVLTTETTTGNSFIEKDMIAIGIQGEQGTAFKLGEGNTITLGKTGIYELDLTDLNSVLGAEQVISIPKCTLLSENATIIVDYIYIEKNDQEGSVK